MIALLQRFLGPYRAKAIGGIVAKMVEVVLELMTPLVVARMIDEGVAQKDIKQVMLLGCLLIVFALVSYGSTLVCQRLAAQVSQGLGTNVRDALYGKVNELSPEDVSRFGTASLVTRVTNDVNQVQLAVAICVRMLTRWPLLAVGSIIAAIFIDMRLGLVFVVCIPAITLVFALVMRASVPFYRAMQSKLDRISLVVGELLGGMRVVRAFGQERHERDRARVAIEDQANTAVGVGRLSTVLNPATFLIMNLGVAAILWIGGLRVSDGNLTTGQVMAFVSYMSQTLIAITYVANLVVVLMRGQTSSVRIMEVLECEPSLSDEGNRPVPVPPANIKTALPTVEFRRVSFTYPGSTVPAVLDVSLRMACGETLGIIGGTGSGKSTFINLLPRLFDATEGEVRVYDEDVREYPFGQLRGLVSVVPQQVTLVTGTVRSNLCWRDPNASDEELWHTLEIAQAAPFVRLLPEGLDAPVEAGGKNFSGGQRQRLTIARALVGEPRILVLDDAASALDFVTDAKLRKALRESTRNLTTIIVSQRVSAVMGADKILVLDHGRMAGLGTHDQLVDRCTLYREICESQLKSDDVRRAHETRYVTPRSPEVLREAQREVARRPRIADKPALPEAASPQPPAQPAQSQVVAEKSARPEPVAAEKPARSESKSAPAPAAAPKPKPKPKPEPAPAPSVSRAPKLRKSSFWGGA